MGYFIYQRTMARARELEIAELEAGGNGVGDDGRAASRSATYNDADADDVAMMADDISLWDNEEREDGYRDFTDDDEPDVFASGDAAEGPKRQGLR